MPLEKTAKLRHKGMVLPLAGTIMSLITLKPILIPLQTSLLHNPCVDTDIGATPLVLKLLNRWSFEGLLLESAAEIEMATILETGPGTNARAIFARAAGWKEALKTVASEPMAIARSKLIVFPQVVVNRFRTDFLVVVANVAPVMKRSTLRCFGFIVECDGLLGHAETTQQVIDDLERERVIRAETGMDVLRFSGAEVMYQQREVQAVVGAQVEALAALREHGEAVSREAQAVLECVAGLSAHRALRSDYTLGNSQRSTLEPYEPEDPFGEWDFPAALLREASWDRFLNLRLESARLYHAIARARQAAPDVDEDETNGELKPFQQALVDALETAFANFSRPR